MKRLKYLLLIGLLTCTVGCQKQGRELFPVELGEPDPAKVSETDPVEPVQNTEDKPEETTVEETISYSGEKDIDDFINENLVLGDDEEIEYSEWVHGFNDYGTFFRVSIGYKGQPENEYKHKRDFFVYRNGDELKSIMVYYPSKDHYDAPRYVYDGNDFKATTMDVNFDGHNDLLINLGYTGPSSGSFWCAYLYYRGEYIYNESFERISNYEIDVISDVIFSSYADQSTPIDSIYKYDEAKNEFTEVCSFNGNDGVLYNLVSNLIVYDYWEDNEDLTEYQIVSMLGEQESGTYTNKDGFEVYYWAKMPIEDLEAFYSEVLGEDKTFEEGYDDSSEAGIFCKDGYAYACNGVGWSEYAVIKNVEESDKGVKVYCDLNNAYMGTRDAAFNFTLTKSDNKFGYSLAKESVKYTADSRAIYDKMSNSEKLDLKGEDFTFKYGDNTFDISNDWSDYVDALGYPDNYEENNYGYITTDTACYRWSLRYPSQADFKYDFQVVLASPSMDREGEDTYIESIILIQTETARGIKAGDSVSDIAAAYGRSFDINLHDGSDVWIDITYKYMDEYILVFVVGDNEIKYIKMYHQKIQ